MRLEPRYQQRMTRRCITTVMLIGFALVSIEASAEVVLARGSWAALRFSQGCEASARPLAPASKRDPGARAGFGFAKDRHGQFHVRLSRPARSGSSPILTVGDQPFLLVARGQWAWSRARQTR